MKSILDALTNARALNVESRAVSAESLKAATQETKLVPPYLRYNVPAERIQIDARIKAKKRNLLPAEMVPDRGLIEGLLVPQFTGPRSGHNPLAMSTLRSEGAVARLTENVSPVLPPNPGPAVSISPANAKTSSAISVVPSGVVAVGWNCTTDFRAGFSSGQASTTYDWWIECGPNLYYLDTNDIGKIYFSLDGPSYFPASQPGIGSAQLRIRCDVESRKNGASQAFSDPVTLNFTSQTPCVALQNASFPDEQATCELVGNNHGQRPKIRVDLTSAAGPTGQTVFLILNDPHDPAVGRWSAGVDSFEIPFGQTSGEWEGFLGTRAVASKKTISIRARVNGQESQPLTIDVKRN